MDKLPAQLAARCAVFIGGRVLTAVNVWFQTHGSGQTIREVTFLQRILGAGAALWFYLLKALVPIQLAFIYPQWNIETDSWRWWLPSIAAIVVTARLWRQRNTAVGRPVLVAWTCFCIALLPVLGFTDVGFMQYSLVADHYQHLALVPVLAVVAAGVYQLYQRQNQAARPMTSIAAVVVVAVLAVLARNQSSLYANGETLYLDTLAKNPDSSLARYNLGVIFSESGRPKMAIPQFEAALGLKPDYPECETSLGLRKAVWGKPTRQTSTTGTCWKNIRTMPRRTTISGWHWPRQDILIRRWNIIKRR